MSQKKKKPQKLKARLPRGFPDRSPGDIRATDEMLGKIKSVYERFGFEPVETPMFEYTDALGKFLPDTDRPNAGVFSLQDDDDQWMSLRYDLTAPLARHVAENFNEIQLPYRTYRNGWVFRNEKPGPGRFRQFMQFDADIVGAPGVQADAEMCMMMADTMEALGIKRGDYVIRVNNRKILDGVMEAIGLGGEGQRENRLQALRTIDKWDRLGNDGVIELLTVGRKDESGDFTDGLGLGELQANQLLNFAGRQPPVTRVPFSGKYEEDIWVLLSEGVDHERAKSDPKIAEKWFASLYTLRTKNRIIVEDIMSLFPESALVGEACSEYIKMVDIWESSGFDVGRIRIDSSCVRGLEYYTGPVYEAELLFDVVNEKGKKVQFGSVGGGGRYDGLVSRFMGQPVPATGFSIGVSRLMTALKNLGKLETGSEIGPVLVTVMDKSMLADYAQLAQKLRTELAADFPDIPVELYQGNPKNFGNQLKYADRRNCPVAIIQGSDEKDAGEVQIKNLIEGKRLSEDIEDNAAWRAARPAQVSVSVDEMVAEVKDILAAQLEDLAKARNSNSGETS